MRLLFTLFLGLLFQCYSLGQSIKGQIKFDDDKVADILVKNILIQNQRTKQKVLSDDHGDFQITAVLDDTISFQSDFINKRYIIVRENHFMKAKNVVFVEQAIINLQEVKLHDLDKNLNQNIRMKEDNINQLYLSLGLDPSIRDIKPQQNFSKFNGGDLFNPIRLVNHLTGRNRKGRAIQQYENKYEKLDHIQAIFGEDYFVDELKIPKEKIKEFIRYVDAKQNLTQLYKTATVEIMEDVMVQRSQEYLKLLRDAGGKKD